MNKCFCGSTLRKLVRHPIVQAGLILLTLRALVGIGVALFVPETFDFERLGHDLMNVMWSSGQGILLIGALLVIWQFSWQLRSFVTAVSFVLFSVLIFFAISDPILDTVIGERLTPSTFQHFRPTRLFTSDAFWKPVIAYWPFVLSGIVLLTSYILWLFRLYWTKGRKPASTPVTASQVVALMGVGFVLILLSSVLSRQPIKLPVEVIYAQEVLGMDTTQLPIAEQDAIATLRRVVGLPDNAAWIDDQYPLAFHWTDKHGVENSARRPDIVMIFVESMRAQNLKPFNPNAEWHVDAPSIERLAQEAVVYPTLLSTGFPTSVGFASGSAGIWPHIRKRIIPEFPNTVFDQLGSRLASAGYHTIIVDPDSRWDRRSLWANGIFTEVIDLSQKGVPNRDANVMQAAIDRVQEYDQSDRQEPFMLMLSTREPHMPYEWPDPQTGQMTFGSDYSENYRKSFAAMDRELGRLLDILRQRDRWDDTVVMVFGDHSNILTKSSSSGLPKNDFVWTGGLIAGGPSYIGKPRIILEEASLVDFAMTATMLARDYRPLMYPGRDLLNGTPGRAPQALAIRGGGSRLDRAGASTEVKGHNPLRSKTTCSLTLKALGDNRRCQKINSTDVSPAEIDIVVRLWSLLVETNRVWTPALLNWPIPKDDVAAAFNPPQIRSVRTD